MKHFLIAFVFLCTWLYFGIRYYECNVKQLCNVESTPTVVKPPKVIKKKPLTYLPFLITKNVDTVAVVNRISNPLQPFYDHLNKYQKEELVVTSFFSKDENSNVAHLRSRSLRKILADFGINTDRVVIQTKQQDLDFSENGQYLKGFAYEFQAMSNERMQTIDKGIASKVLYAGFESKTFEPDNTLNAYAIELKNYLEKHPDKQVEIIGHTDSNGDAEANMWYGKERAKSVMQYFVSQGIDAERLRISSKGETTPIASNTTIEGQRLNRRIEINITN